MSNLTLGATTAQHLGSIDDACIGNTELNGSAQLTVTPVVHIALCQVAIRRIVRCDDPEPVGIL